MTIKLTATNNRTFTTSKRAIIIRILYAFELEWAWGLILSLVRSGTQKLFYAAGRAAIGFTALVHATIYAVCYNVQYLRNSFYQQIPFGKSSRTRPPRGNKNLFFLLFTTRGASTCVLIIRVHVVEGFFYKLNKQPACGKFHPHIAFR